MLVTVVVQRCYSWVRLLNCFPRYVAFIVFLLPWKLEHRKEELRSDPAPYI